MIQENKIRSVKTSHQQQLRNAKIGKCFRLPVLLYVRSVSYGVGEKAHNIMVERWLLDSSKVHIENSEEFLAFVKR